MPVDVAVTLILDGERILLIYNESWGAFTLPMTKRKRPDPPTAGDANDGEDWLDAAARPVVECLGRPNRPVPVLEDFVPESQFSRRRQVNVIYRYKTFKVNFEKGDRVIAPTYTWLTASEILEGNLHPISQTAIDIIRYQDILRALGFSI
jgi:hypothetical protein